MFGFCPINVWSFMLVLPSFMSDGIDTCKGTCEHYHCFETESNDELLDFFFLPVLIPFGLVK